MIDTIDKHNVKIMNTCEDAKEELFICSCCERLTNMLDSISYMGYNLHCEHCITKIAKATGETAGETIRKISKVGLHRCHKRD